MIVKADGLHDDSIRNGGISDQLPEALSRLGCHIAPMWRGAKPSQPRVVTAADARVLLEARFNESPLERLLILSLDAGQRLLDLSEIAGEQGSVGMPVQRIVTAALRAGAAGLIVAHNHPSGDPAPSAADIGATRRLGATARIAGLTLHDHLIFAGTRCTSMRVAGLL